MKCLNFFNVMRASAKVELTKATHQPEHYVPPIHQCTRSVLLCGAAYGDVSYRGAYLLDTKAAKELVTKHSTSVWSVQKKQQQAREYIPLWFANPVLDDDHVALLDTEMRGVLMPYLLDFYNKGWISIYCPKCDKSYTVVTQSKYDAERNGRHSTWTEAWHCAAGHIVHTSKNELIWFKPRNGDGASLLPDKELT